uniref:Uncharacterized protein n=1 Tax=Anopheles stephensi TaxID=30069 RepID=A0A182YR62_ANOST
MHAVKSKFEVASNMVIDLSEELEQVVTKSARKKVQIHQKNENQLKIQESIIEKIKADVELSVSNAPIMFDEQDLTRIKQNWENEEKQYQTELETLQHKLMCYE